jgi:CheY-like chemotaxis protein
MNILIVEDERLISIALSLMVSNAGHKVSACVPSAAAALALLSRERPDLILMDIKIEGTMDGIEAAARIRERWNIPIVFATAFGDAETRERALALSPLAFLDKPISPERLAMLLDTASTARPPGIIN